MKRFSFGEFFAERMIRASGFLAIGFVVLIFIFLLREGLPAFVEVPPGQLLSTRWYPIEDLFGLSPLILGSVIVTLGAALIAVPTGVLTAVFVAEVAHRDRKSVV